MSRMALPEHMEIAVQEAPGKKKGKDAILG